MRDTDAIQDRQALLENVAALEANAVRYLWLRDPTNARSPAWDVIMSEGSSPEEIDAAIDAAMGIAESEVDHG